jgi:hypothetical protein
MREPPPSRINLPVLVFVVALHAAVFAYAVHAPAPSFEASPRRSAAAPTDPATPQTRPPEPAPARGDDISADDARAIDDPRREFTPQQWRDNQTAAARTEDRRRFGALDSPAAPAALPRAIEHGLRRGDAGAATAAAELHDDCSELGDAAPIATTLDAALLIGLDAGAQALVRADFEARVQRLARRQQRCAAWRAARDSLARARHDYAARSDADAFEKLRTALQLDPPTPSLLERVHAELRSLWESQSQSRVGRALVLQMLAHDNEAQDRVGLRLLLELAERDDTQVEFAADVLSRGFGHLPPQPDLAPQWQRRAADLGADAAIAAQLADASAPAAQAWAWRAWRIWLNAHGCYVDAPRAEDALLAADLRALQQLDARLSPESRAEAGRLYLERTQTFGDRARAVRHCDAEAPDFR